MIGDAKAPSFALGYGALERAIAGLVDSDAEAVRVRFRKLRLRPFPPDIRTGTGVRVRYDLARCLAIAAVFELNAMALPQQTAVGMVERAWPEACRAAICAAADLGFIARPAAAPSDASSILTVLPDAFASGAAADVTAARVDDKLAQSASSIRLDAKRLLAALTAEDVDGGAMAIAFADLDARFGWGTPEEIARPRPEGDFLVDGPFFPRAQALLSFTTGDVGCHSRQRMQALVDYLAHPAPVDAWKGAVGLDRHPLSLWHRLLAYAIDLGLDARLPASVVAAAVEDEPGRTARELIRLARNSGPNA